MLQFILLNIEFNQQFWADILYWLKAICLINYRLFMLYISVFCRWKSKDELIIIIIIKVLPCLVSDLSDWISVGGIHLTTDQELIFGA